MKYFAYGSNMDVKRMEKRGIAFSDRRAGNLLGYRLEFNKVARTNIRKGYANIVPDDSGLVEGALYEIEAILLPKLDKKEGYPEHYLKIPVEVILHGNDQKICAITYIANPNKIRDGLKPSKEYMGYLFTCKDILSKNYFEWLQEIETLD